MKVEDCKQCKYCERRVWYSYHQPANYHAIGMSHAYAYCRRHGKRVSKVGDCWEAYKPRIDEINAKLERGEALTENDEQFVRNIAEKMARFITPIAKTLIEAFKECASAIAENAEVIKDEQSN